MTRRLAAIVSLALVLPSASLATVPGTSGRIVFASTRDGNEDVYSANPDGSDARNLTRDPAADSMPASSPDGTRIAFVSDRDGRRDLYVMGADGSNPTRITDGYYLSVDTEPTWSPDGTQIAFASTRPFNDGWHIWAMDADGSNLRQLTSGFGVSPSWSPDGSRIAYDNLGSIWLMNADGSGAQQLTAGATPESAPAWSPSGSQLVFGRYRADWQTSNVHNLWVIDADGSHERQLTVAGTYDGHASWSPDGGQIVFQRHFLPPYSGTELYVTRADGTFLYAIDGAGDNYQPDWAVATGAPPPPPTRDVTPPTITISSPREGDVFTLGQHVLADYSCADESGIIHCAGSVASGDPIATGWIGVHQFGVDATDGAENPAFQSVSYRVVFAFNGFAAPIIAGSWNTAKAGDGVPLKFSLGGNYGLDVLADAGQQAIDCTSATPLGQPAPASGSFTYNASLDRYMYVWPTSKTWAGSCRSITLTLADGTRHRIDLRLTK